MLLLVLDPLTSLHYKRIVDLAMKIRLPSMYPFAAIRGGRRPDGLWNQHSDLYRRAATTADKILKGRRPVDPPVEQPMKFESLSI